MADGTSAADEPARRPGGRTARVRARIFEATVELVTRDGITGFRYEEIAERAGVHRTTVYRNWPDREELIVEALLRYADDVMPIPDTGDLRDDLVNFLVDLATNLATPTGRALAAATWSGQDSPANRRAVARVGERRLALVRERVERAVERDELPRIDNHLFSEMLSGPIHLLVNREMRDVSRTDVARIVDVVLSGVRATAGGCARRETSAD